MNYIIFYISVIIFKCKVFVFYEGSTRRSVYVEGGRAFVSTKVKYDFSMYFLIGVKFFCFFFRFFVNLFRFMNFVVVILSFANLISASFLSTILKYALNICMYVFLYGNVNNFCMFVFFVVLFLSFFFSFCCIVFLYVFVVVVSSSRFRVARITSFVVAFVLFGYMFFVLFCCVISVLSVLMLLL